MPCFAHDIPALSMNSGECAPELQKNQNFRDIDLFTPTFSESLAAQLG